MKRALLPILATLILVGCGKKEPAIDIWTAAATGNTAAIEQHVSFGADLDAKEPNRGSTPLIVAAVFGRTEIAKLLIENGANLDATNNDGSTALHTAAFFCHPEIVKFLLERGAELSVTNSFGHTPLDTVSAAWSPELENTYKMFAQAFQLDLDLQRIREVRPQVADLIRQHSER